MAVENLKSTKVTNFEASPETLVDARDGQGGVVRYYEDTITTVETTSSNTSTYKLCPLPSHARILDLTVQGVGSVDSPNVDVGVIGADGENLDDDGITTALDIDDTGHHKAVDYDTSTGDALKQVWEYSAATSDPGGIMYIHLSLDADNVAAGTIKVRALVVE